MDRFRPYRERQPPPLKRGRGPSTPQSSDQRPGVRRPSAVVDQLGQLADAGGHATIRTDVVGSALIYEAVSTYVTMRDLESHQAVEERARLALLNGLLDDLRELRSSLEVAGAGASR